MTRFDPDSLADVAQFGVTQRQSEYSAYVAKSRTRKRVLIVSLYVAGLASFYLAAGPYAVAGALLVLLAGVI